MKLAVHLARRPGQRVLYVLDEPTTGLHIGDIAELAGLLPAPAARRGDAARHRAQHGRRQARGLGDRPRARRRRRGRAPASSRARRRRWPQRRRSLTARYLRDALTRPRAGAAEAWVAASLRSLLSSRAGSCYDPVRSGPAATIAFVVARGPLSCPAAAAPSPPSRTWSRTSRAPTPAPARKPPPRSARAAAARR